MFAVVFEVQPRTEAWDDYLDHAAALRPELLGIDGFIANERFASRQRSGWLVSLSIWHTEKALIRWRTHALHHLIQGKGRSSVFLSYRLRVGEIVADSTPEWPLVQQRFDVTETAAAKAVSLTEWTADQPDPPRGQPLEHEQFDSITTPGRTLLLQSWPDTEMANAALTDTPGRHRVVRVIRDYGMRDRAEAPQYFPPVEP